jgi:hypothetical protein
VSNKEKIQGFSFKWFEIAQKTVQLFDRIRAEGSFATGHIAQNKGNHQRFSLFSESSRSTPDDDFCSCINPQLSTPLAEQV